MTDNNGDGISDRPLSKLEKVQALLDSKNAVIHEHERATLSSKNFSVPREWKQDLSMSQTSSKKNISMSWIKKIFIGSLVFFIIAVIVALISLSGGRNIVSTDAIDLEIVTVPFADGGKPFDATIQIINRNTADLELADLVLEYPKSSVTEGEKVRERRPLGNVRSGQTISEDFEPVLFGEEGEERTLQARLEYRVAGSNAIFVKETDVVIALQSTPVEISLEAPDSSVQNQTISVTLKIKSNATEVTENMLVAVEYPTGFVFDSAEPKPTIGNASWYIGDLAPGSEKEITLRGEIKGLSGDDRVFRAFIGPQNPRNERDVLTAFNSAIHTVKIENPFLGAVIRIAGKEDDQVPVTSGRSFSVFIDWENTLPERLRNVEITARLSGNAFDSTKVIPKGGFFNSADNTVTWSATTSRNLELVEPGSRGTFEIGLTPKSLISGTTVIKQPEIIVDVNVRGVTSAGSIQSAENVAQKRAIVNSDIQLTQRTQYYGSIFASSGPYPPKVEVPTTLTVVWTVTNSANAVDDAKVSTSLPIYIDWLGQVSPNNETVTYNSVSREVVWNIGSLPAGAGFDSDKREVSFQVSISPSASQRNQTPNITSDVTLEGKDRFTETLLRTIRRPHTTQLLNDIKSGTGQVQ